MMKFSTSIWRILGRGGVDDNYLFVDAEIGLIIVVYRFDIGSRSQMTGFGIWFYELGDFEIATTIAKRSGKHSWLCEYYRIYDDWMQWSNYQAEIFHELVTLSDLSEESLEAYESVKERCRKRTKPDYDPASFRECV